MGRGLTVTKGAAPVQILAVVDPQVSFTVQVAQAAATTVNGRKIVKAGTPLTGSLKARNTAFTKAADSEDASNAVGVLLHDVDVTDGAMAGSLLVFGFVDLTKLDTTTAALITATVETALKGKVTFIK